MIAGLLPMLDNISFIFACADFGYSIFAWWFGLTMVITSLLRLVYESRFFHGEEVLHITRNFGSEGGRKIACAKLLAEKNIAHGAQEIAITGFAYAHPQVTWTPSIWRDATLIAKHW